MINKPASVATEFELPPLSEGTPPLLLARVSERSSATSNGTGAVGALEPALRNEARPEPNQPLTLATGDLVAERYRVGPVIGAGGMGIVYKAQHVELGTWVAIKVIRPEI